jgi:general secretion pathway protein I
LSRQRRSDSAEAGFTLIEVLIALSILAVGTAAIGSMVATNMRGVRSVEAHLMRLETARSIVAALPGRDQLTEGSLKGNIGDHSWRVDVLPFATQDAASTGDVRWVPRTITVTSRSPNGIAMKVSTIRLQRRTEK